MNGLFLTVKELNYEEVESLNSEFELALSNPSAREEMTNAMDKNLRNFSVRDDYKFRMSYFRWYTELVWRRLTMFSAEIMVAVAIGRQVPMAILLNFDVVQEVILYLNAKTDNAEDMANLFSKIKNAFLESKAVLGVWEEKEVTVAEIVKEFFSIKQHGGDSLETAEFNSKLQEILFSTNDPLVEKYVLVDTDTAIYRLTQLILFFYLVEPKDIWYAVNVFMYPEKVGEAPPLTATPPAPATPVATTAKLQPQVIMPKKEEIKKEEPKMKPPAPATPPAPPLGKRGIERLTIAQVKSQIESQFKKDADGNFVDIEGVYKKLGELAEKYNDAKINDLIYYDESSGKFLWK